MKNLSKTTIGLCLTAFVASTASAGYWLDRVKAVLDLNHDYVVDKQEAQTFQGKIYWGLRHPEYKAGDLNFDGATTYEDYALLANTLRKLGTLPLPQPYVNENGFDFGALTAKTATSNRCEITTYCPERGITGTIKDSAADPNRPTTCLLRAHDYQSWCPSHPQVTAKAFFKDYVVGQVTVASGSFNTCEITVEDCPYSPWNPNGLAAQAVDNYENSQNDIKRCMLRAQDVQSYCLSMKPVIARHFTMGAQDAQGYVGPVRTFGDY